MGLLDVRRVFVVQDRQSGLFVDCEMDLVCSLRHAARVESMDIVRESMNGALYEGRIECPEGYEVHSFFEAANEWER